MLAVEELTKVDPLLGHVEVLKRKSGHRIFVVNQVYYGLRKYCLLGFVQIGLFLSEELLQLTDNFLEFSGHSLYVMAVHCRQE